MKRNRISALLLAGVMLVSAACTAHGAEDETRIVLSDAGITVNGSAASTEETAAVYTGAEIIYYRDGTDESYGEGTGAEKHSAREAAAHTVVTITRPGTYRLSGSLSAGQISVDLGKGAKDDPQAVVTLILDNVDVKCTVAPALIFYNVYECDREFVAYDGDENPDYEASPYVDTSAAGANVVLTAGSVNTFIGSHVARIYKVGTTKKLHKYDGAFYSRMSMNIFGDNGDDSGVLNIIADNEGLDSELHLTLNGGTVNIESQDDGINTNEDLVSVTTVNGGALTVNAGLGSEGDGIDSNGYLVINGGTVWTMANERTPDGGIDADGPILINGGTLYAFGTRNDAADSASGQACMELSFAATLPAGSVVTVREGEREIWTARTQKACQTITLTTPELKLDIPYQVYVDGALQCWSGNSFGMGRLGGFGGGRPQGMEPPPDFEGFRPDGGADLPEEMGPGERVHPFEGGFPGFGAGTADGSGSTDFMLTETTRSFSGVCGSDQSEKAWVSFRDLREGDAGYDAVKALCRAGVLRGTGENTFSPDAPVTRSQAVTALGRLAGAEERGTAAFSDVASGSWYAGYVGWAVENGIVKGDGQGRFLPDAAVTAEQLALMLERYSKDYVNSMEFSGPLTRLQMAQMLADVLP